MLKTFSEHRNAKEMRETNIYLCISKMYLLNHEIKCFLCLRGGLLQEAFTW